MTAKGNQGDCDECDGFGHVNFVPCGNPIHRGSLPSKLSPSELRVYFDAHRAGYDMGRKDQKREDDELIAVLFSKFDHPKKTGADE